MTIIGHVLKRKEKGRHPEGVDGSVREGHKDAAGKRRSVKVEKGGLA